MFRRDTKYLTDILKRYLRVIFFLHRNGTGYIAHYLSDLFFQITHPRLSGISLDNTFYLFLTQLNMFVYHAMFFKHFRKKKMSGYFYFFFDGISRDIDNLHSVLQSRLYGTKIISCSDKHHFGEVVTNLQKIIVELIILFRIKHFQHSRRGISSIANAKLVEFVKDKNRIRSACLFD